MGHLSAKRFLAASVAALSLMVCSVAAGADRTAECSPWEFNANAETEGGPEPQASLPCKDNTGITIMCVAGDFIAGLRYYPSNSAPDEEGYRQFRFQMGKQSFDMWLRLEAMDGAWSGYTEFAHPLFTAMRSEKGPMEVTDVAKKTKDVLPLTGAGKAFDGLLKACQSSG
jgi:hypothetical protein